MTCGGFGSEVFGGCTIAWLVLAVLVFVALIARRQIIEYTDIPFNIIGAMAGALLPFLIIISFTGNNKWSFLAGLIGTFIGGYAGGLILGESE